MRFKTIIFDKSTDLAKAYVALVEGDIKNAELTDTYLDSKSEEKEVIRHFRKILVSNDTGKDVEIAFITSAYDTTRFVDDPEEWGWLRIKNGEKYIEVPHRTVSGIVARTVDGTASTNDLRVDLSYP